MACRWNARRGGRGIWDGRGRQGCPAYIRAALGWQAHLCPHLFAMVYEGELAAVWGHMFVQSGRAQATSLSKAYEVLWRYQPYGPFGYGGSPVLCRTIFHQAASQVQKHHKPGFQTGE